MLKEKYPGISHYYDPWHYFRNLTLNLMKVTNRLITTLSCLASSTLSLFLPDMQAILHDASEAYLGKNHHQQSLRLSGSCAG